VSQQPQSQAAARGRLAWLNPKVLIAGIVLAIAVAYLMYTGVQGTSASYFVTVSELTARAESVDGQRVRVGGEVKAGSVQYDGVGGPLYFAVTDGIESIPVVYHEIVPDIFAEHGEVVIEGTFHAGGTFEAESVLTKCPSRFEAED
jgi:cytochrome c-type biogenesis protein CcmE